MTSQERRSSRLQEVQSSAGDTQDFFNQLNSQSQTQPSKSQLQPQPPNQTIVEKGPGIYLNSSPLILININVKFMQFRISELLLLLDKLST